MNEITTRHTGPSKDWELFEIGDVRKLLAAFEAAKVLGDIMSEAAYRSNPRMSDGYCEPMGGVAPHKLLHRAEEIKNAVKDYDAALRELEGE